jgi:hypothetical protein
MQRVCGFALVAGFLLTFISSCGLGGMRTSAATSRLVRSMSLPFGFVMLDDEPLCYPPRGRYPFDPAVPDKQLWATGMIVVQWSAAEYFIELDTLKLINKDEAVLAEFKKIRNFQQRLAFWEGLLKPRGTDSEHKRLIELLPTIKALSSQRDQVVHRLWAGGMERMSPSTETQETADAGMMPRAGFVFDKLSKSSPLLPFEWGASFIRLRRMAQEMAQLNVALLSARFAMPGPAHGGVGGSNEVAS